MTRENAQTKGRRYTVEGRLIVTHVDARTARATCRGDGSTYDLGYDQGRWWCTCPARTRCAHLAALGLVVGFPAHHNASARGGSVRL